MAERKHAACSAQRTTPPRLRAPSQVRRATTAGPALSWRVVVCGLLLTAHAQPGAFIVYRLSHGDSAQIADQEIGAYIGDIGGVQ
jgi:hypothetical protein